MSLALLASLTNVIAQAQLPPVDRGGVPLELAIISCDPDMTYQDYDVNCQDGGTGILDCTDPEWGWYSPLTDPPTDCTPGRDRRPFGTLSINVPCDFTFEIVKTPPGIQQGVNQTMVSHDHTISTASTELDLDRYCRAVILWPGTDKVSWWMGNYIQNAYTRDPEAPVPPPYLKQGTVQIGCEGDGFN